MKNNQQETMMLQDSTDLKFQTSEKDTIFTKLIKHYSFQAGDVKYLLGLIDLRQIL